MVRRHLVINLLACGKSETLVSAGQLARMLRTTEAVSKAYQIKPSGSPDSGPSR